MARLTLSDCTLVPGWGREDEQPRGSEPSLALLDTAVQICITRSILGAIRVIRNEPTIAPSVLFIEGSIVDAVHAEAVALGGDDGRFAALVATIRQSTILGATRVHAIALAENSLFTGSVRVARRQQGCVRFCYMPFDSRTPSRYQCPPDPQDAERSEPFAEARRRIKPDFVSTRYGDPGYCQLARSCAKEIRRGAEDRSELGVFHDLFEPQRLDMLVAAVSDFAGVGTQSGVVFVD
jgi:hypothetical protein